MWKEAVWLNLPKSEIEREKILQGDMNGRFAYYRCEIVLEESGTLVADITANSRYRLWVNGEPILSGPCKGDRYRHYYETVDLSDKLICGKNVFAVQVLLCDQNAVSHQYEERAPLFSVASMPGVHRLSMEGKIISSSGDILGEVTTGKAEWKVFLDGSFYLIGGDEATANLGALKENIDFNIVPADWKYAEFNAAAWAEPEKSAMIIDNVFGEKVGLYGSHRVIEREIPLLFEQEENFSKEQNEWLKKTVRINKYKGNSRKQEEGFVIHAGEKLEVVLDAGVHTNAYLKYGFANGAGAKVELTYSEKYFSTNGTEIKRTDNVHGVLKGITDKLILNGEKIVYEPFWFRTFRFIKIVINAGDEDVIFYEPVMRKTGYPLQVKTEITTNLPEYNKLWEISLRTLQNCMTETYMDCPFYEQMQFSIDTRLQMLFTYVVTQDVCLAKKALKDFHCSMIPEGLIQGKYPSGYPQIISTFSLHYIYMLKEYYMQTGDKETLRRYRTDVDVILDYFERCIGDVGLVENVDFWQFVDWQAKWKENMGVPEAVKYGPSTIINLMYAYALQNGAYIYDVTGRKETAQEYRNRQKKIIDRIQELCWDEKHGIYREGPEFKQFSQHAQGWAILNHMVSKEQQEIF